MSDDELYTSIWEQMDDLDDVGENDIVLLCVPDGVSDERFDKACAEVAFDRDAEIRRTGKTGRP